MTVSHERFERIGVFPAIRVAPFGRLPASPHCLVGRLLAFGCVGSPGQSMARGVHRHGRQGRDDRPVRFRPLPIAPQLTTRTSFSVQRALQPNARTVRCSAATRAAEGSELSREQRGRLRRTRRSFGWTAGAIRANARRSFCFGCSKHFERSNSKLFRVSGVARTFEAFFGAGGPFRATSGPRENGLDSRCQSH